MKHVNRDTHLEEGYENARWTYVRSLPLPFTACLSCAISKSAELQTTPHHGVTQIGAAQSDLFSWSDVVSKWLFYGSVHISACESKELSRQV